MLKVVTLVKQGWYNECSTTNIFKCTEIFTRYQPTSPPQMKHFAKKRQVKRMPSSFEASFPFHFTTVDNTSDSRQLHTVDPKNKKSKPQSKQ